MQTKWSGSAEYIEENMSKMFSGQPNSFIMTAFYKETFGFCLEVAAKSIEAAIDKIQIGGSIGIEGGVAQAMTRDRAVSFLIMKGKRTYATALEYFVPDRGDLEMMRSVEAMHGRIFNEKAYLEDLARKSPRIVQVSVSAFDNTDQERLQKHLASHDPGTWHPTAMFDTTMSIEDVSETGWSEWSSGASNCHSDGIESWQEYFALLRSAIVKLGLIDIHRKDAAGMIDRNYLSHDANQKRNLKHYDGAEALACVAATLDVFLPGRNSDEFFSRIEAEHRGNAMNYHGGKFLGMFEMLRDGGFTEEEFRIEEHNIGVRLAVDDTNVEAVIYRGSNVAYALVRSANPFDASQKTIDILVLSDDPRARKPFQESIECAPARIRAGDKTGMLASFAREDGDGAWILTSRPDPGIRSGRNWATFYSEMDAIHDCLTEALAAQRVTP